VLLFDAKPLPCGVYEWQGERMLTMTTGARWLKGQDPRWGHSGLPGSAVLCTATVLPGQSPAPDVQQAGSKGKDAGTIARGAETGADGSYGALGGGAAELVHSLLTRDNDVNLEQGQTVEMVLQRPLPRTPASLAAAAAGPGAGWLPAAQQSMKKPDRAHRICPLGGLECQ
jgi:hypothetical protein